MFENGSILWIPNYVFDDGTTHPQGKLYIILHLENNEKLIAALTTSVDNVPEEHEGKRSVNDHEKRLSFYFFPKKLAVCENGWSFDVDTFIYFQSNITENTIENLTEQYGSIIEQKGILTKTEYLELIYTAFHSSFLRKKQKEKLENLFAELYEPQ